MKISLIKPYEKNAKKHSKKQIQQLANSIKEFGFNQPVVVDKDGVLIVGHGRLEAAKFLGFKEVPAITLDISEEKANAYRLADNKLNESEWDMKLVIDELKNLNVDIFDLTGFDKDLIITSVEIDVAGNLINEYKLDTDNVSAFATNQVMLVQFYLEKYQLDRLSTLRNKMNPELTIKDFIIKLLDIYENN